MPYVSLYRKYRSQSFDEVSGQEHVTRTIQNAIRSGRVAHAYLFCGPRGTGKTTTARLLAKALNCENGPCAEPCNVCTACTQITEGRYLDMAEIDAASNRGIDEIRSLRDSVAYASAHGGYKVYVVDEAHQITGDAFNAFLKTLEEPPPRVIFIMATTEAHKIPATIISRCQRFEFRRASLEQLRERVAWVAAQEGAEVEPAALDLIAREANGGWRDALSLLEQVLSFCGDRVTAADVYTVLGTVAADTLFRLGDGILSADGAEVFRLLDELITEGKDPRQLIRDLTAHYRCLMLSAAGSTVISDPDHAAQTAAQGAAYGHQRLIAAIEVLAQTEREARWSEQPRLLLELAVVRLMHPRASSPEAPAENRSTAERAAQRPAAAAPAGRKAEPERPPLPAKAAPVPEPSPFVDEKPPAARKATDRARPSAGFGKEELPPPPLTVGDARMGSDGDDDDLSIFNDLPAAPAPRPAGASAVPMAPTAPTPESAGAAAPEAASSGDLDIAIAQRKWKIVLEELIREKKMVVYSFLADSRPDRFDHDELVIRVPSATSAESFAKNNYAAPVAQVVQKVLGVKCRVRAEAGATPAPKAGATTGPRTTAGRSAATAPPRLASPASSRPPAPAAPPPGGTELVHDVIEVFDGRVLDDRE